MTDQRLFVSFVDESGSNRTLDPGTYLLSAAIVEPHRLLEIRDSMAQLALPGQKKLHWRDESDLRRLLIARSIYDFSLEHLVVVRSDAPDDRPERQRRRCLQRLTYELDQLGVDRMTLESRGPQDDRRDRAALDAFRRSGNVSPSLRMFHQPGPEEPLLWLPDAVCGAMVGHRTGNPEPWNVLKSQCTVVTCS